MKLTSGLLILILIIVAEDQTNGQRRRWYDDEDTYSWPGWCPCKHRTTEAPYRPTTTTTPTTTTVTTTTTTTVKPKPPCNPDPATYLVKNGFIYMRTKYYYYSRDLKTWNDAKNFCQSKGAQLAHPMSAYENNYLVAYAKVKPPGTAYYLGGHDMGHEGVWVWSHNNGHLGFKAWPSGRPDNYKGVQHCLSLWRLNNYAWDDVECNAQLNYICQASVSTFTKRLCP